MEGLAGPTIPFCQRRRRCCLRRASLSENGGGETIALGFQHYILALGTAVMIPTFRVPLMGGDDFEAQFSWVNVNRNYEPRTALVALLNGTIQLVDGKRNTECLTWGIDKERVLRGRTAVEVYFDHLRSFRVEFDEFFEEGIISEIEVGLGPCGELQYPSYPEQHGWKYPGFTHVYYDLINGHCADANVLKYWIGGRIAETAALRASFQQEVDVWHKLDHPNIPKPITHKRLIEKELEGFGISLADLKAIYAFC
ncbi:hypothetical protein COP2_046285 [Malus domestica]